MLVHIDPTYFLFIGKGRMSKFKVTGGTISHFC